MAAYPKLNGLYVPLPNGADAFQGMDDGKCEAAIMDEDAWQVAQGGAFTSSSTSAAPGGRM